MERPYSGWTCREMFEGNGPRELSSSDLTNVSQVSFGLTWVTFQEIPATKIDFRCARISWEKAATTALNVLQQLFWPH